MDKEKFELWLMKHKRLWNLYVSYQDKQRNRRLEKLRSKGKAPDHHVLRISKAVSRIETRRK